MLRAHPARVATAAAGAEASAWLIRPRKKSSAAVEATEGPYSPSPCRQAPAPRAMRPVASTAMGTLRPASTPSHAAPANTPLRPTRRNRRSE